MPNNFKIACLQVSSSDDMAENIRTVEALAREAVRLGAVFLCTPENTCFLSTDKQAKLDNAYSEESHPALPRFKDLARALNVMISIGSLSIKLPNNRLINRSYLIDQSGEIISRYDKIHLFDVTLPNGDVYLESEFYDAGQALVMSETKFGKIGLSICYDVRFPQQYRQYAMNGAEILLVPAAFTVPTGEAHWHSLLRARAIETGCYVVAAAQTGTHQGGRTTYGHSLIISPWGEILSDGGSDTGITIADIDLNNVSKVRSQIPSLRHSKVIEGILT
jgi:predicted amidohydrolase